MKVGWKIIVAAVLVTVIGLCINFYAQTIQLKRELGQLYGNEVSEVAEYVSLLSGMTQEELHAYADSDFALMQSSKISDFSLNIKHEELSLLLLNTGHQLGKIQSLNEQELNELQTNLRKLNLTLDVMTDEIGDKGLDWYDFVHDPNKGVLEIIDNQLALDYT
ncbi:hypothetical protein [Lysinibacillus sp. 54212]|uniref:hypothetical protein n=1 Tax=Lysinibacillus sp. 54212 TaxID=3119829 RepID=UPI002FCA05B5